VPDWHSLHFFLSWGKISTISGNPPIANPIQVWPGFAYPIGATSDPLDTNFALFLPGGSWDLLITTAAKNGRAKQKGDKGKAENVSEEFVVGARSVALLSMRNTEAIT
jgi:hypothetical protein